MKAYLYNRGRYTFFKVNNTVVKFETSPYLIRYNDIKEYDNGYIVVHAIYSNRNRNGSYIEEDYIDMNYILKDIEEVERQ